MGSVIPYFGGKFFLSKILKKYIPPHTTYVEVFGGAANLLFQKKPSEVEVYNDIDSDLVCFFKVLRDNLDEFITMLEFTPYSRQIFNECLEKLENRNFKDDIERAYCFYVVCNMSYSSLITKSSFSYSVSTNKVVKTWNNKKEKILKFSERFKNVIIENLDFENCLERYDRRTTFFYLDPPYIDREECYREKFYERDQKRLVRSLLEIDGMAMISNYDNEIYKELEESGWLKIPLENTLRCSNLKKKNKVIEYIWINYLKNNWW